MLLACVVRLIVVFLQLINCECFLDGLFSLILLMCLWLYLILKYLPDLQMFFERCGRCLVIIVQEQTRVPVMKLVFSYLFPGQYVLSTKVHIIFLYGYNFMLILIFFRQSGVKVIRSLVIKCFSSQNFSIISLSLKQIETFICGKSKFEYT